VFYDKYHDKLFSILVLIGIVFDSYAKEDGTRTSEYGSYDKEKGFEHTIKYPGITIEHIMASAAVPEYFGYACVPIDQAKDFPTSSNDV
jgi:hypothetical protein